MLAAHADGRPVGEAVADAGLPPPAIARGFWRALDPQELSPNRLEPLTGPGANERSSAVAAYRRQRPLRGWRRVDTGRAGTRPGWPALAGHRVRDDYPKWTACARGHVRGQRSTGAPPPPARPSPAGLALRGRPDPVPWPTRGLGRGGQRSAQTPHHWHDLAGYSAPAGRTAGGVAA